jgi:hypothetical protein
MIGMVTIVSAAAAGVGLVCLVVGLHKVSSAARAERAAVATLLRDLSRVQTELGRKSDALAKALDGVERKLPKTVEPEVIAREVERRLVAREESLSRDTSRQKREPPAPLEVVLEWWNARTLSSDQVQGALPELQAQLQAYSIRPASMVRGLVGLVFSPPLPGFHDMIVLPEMTLCAGDLTPIFETANGGAETSRILRTLRPASVDAQYHSQMRGELISLGLKKGLIEVRASA